jgi:hypothetical protein
MFSKMFPNFYFFLHFVIKKFGLDLDPSRSPLRGQQKNFLRFFAYFLKVHLHHFSKIKVINKSQISRNQCFSYYFCLMIEGSGSGSISLTNGSATGSSRPKIIWILLIRIQIQIRNTGLETSGFRFASLSLGVGS